MRRPLDKMTLAGLLIAVGGVIGGHVMQDGTVGELLSGPAFLIVILGSFGAIVASSPYRDVVSGLAGLRTVMFPAPENLVAMRDHILKLASVSRREGMIALEEQIDGSDVDPFLRKTLGMAIDGSSADSLRVTAETDIARRAEAMRGAARFWESWGVICPTIGVLGAVIGLIEVMKGLEHQESAQEMGAGIATAFVATVYGVGFSNMVCLPISFKLHRITQRARLRMSMILEGVVGIQQGVAPSVLRSRLSVYLPEGSDE